MPPELHRGPALVLGAGAAHEEERSAMNAIVVQRSHHLGVVKAKRLAEMMARRLRDEYGGTYAWDGNTRWPSGGPGRPGRLR
jgi:Putative polyhydroxyalkanoic acid system protein (PHA_gran_rgn)